MNKREMLEMTRGKFFSVEFVKQDNTLRKMVARLGVKKHLRSGGAASNTSHIPKYVCAYDVQCKGYRNINLDTLVSIKCGHIQYRAGEE